MDGKNDGAVSEGEENTHIGTSGYSSTNKNNLSSAKTPSRKNSSGNMQELIEQALRGKSAR